VMSRDRRETHQFLRSPPGESSRIWSDLPKSDVWSAIAGLAQTAWTSRGGPGSSRTGPSRCRGTGGPRSPRPRARRRGTRLSPAPNIGRYFDAEGGIPANPWAEPYLYFAQNHRTDLEDLRGMICGLGIKCGRLHNPRKAQILNRLVRARNRIAARNAIPARMKIARVLI
jgi:hypothetical protein